MTTDLGLVCLATNGVLEHAQRARRMQCPAPLCLSHIAVPLLSCVH